MNGDLRFLVVIFAAAKVRPCWAMGVDAFAEWNDNDYTCNFGLGNRHPGLSLIDRDGKAIPVMFAATKNASMDESVLMQAFKMMDDLGITERGIDEDGNPYFPYIILDGHISRIGELFLRYVNDPSTRWGTGLGAPLAIEYYQFHDDPCQNGALKTSLTHEKSEFFLKK